MAARVGVGEPSDGAAGIIGAVADHSRDGDDVASISHSDIARLVLRVGVGGVMAAHRTQKLFGWFGGRGVAGTAGYLESAGFRPGCLNAVVAGV